MIKLSLPSLARLHEERGQSGLIMISVLIVISVLTIVGIALLSSMTSQYIFTNDDTYRANALYVAEAGVEQSVEQLNQSDSFGGYPSPQVFFNDKTQGYGTFTTTITTASDNVKTITSTGSVYRYGTTTNPVSTRIVRVTAVGTSSPGYSVHSGPGGLILGGSAAITNSTVYVNGSITMTGASKIGTTSQPLNVYVANDECPSGSDPGPTYPQVCTDGTQPINLTRSTNIYGTVCATGQTSTGPNNNIQGGSTGQGLQSGCVAPTVSTPTYDRSAQISAVTTTGAGNDNTYVCNSWPFNRTWPANLELTGNVTIGNSCDVDITGNVYITGNLTINGASKTTVDDSLGTTRPVVLVDGTITIGGSAQVVANASGTGIEFISYCSKLSSSASCTQPSSLSGTDLYESSQQPTITVGGAVNLPGMIFDSYWGEAVLNGSGNIGSAIGQTVNMSGAGTITFGTTLSSGTKTWTISSYEQRFPGQT